MWTDVIGEGSGMAPGVAAPLPGAQFGPELVRYE